eukprot:8987061-Pyramimonas_sp.AAC.1
MIRDGSGQLISQLQALSRSRPQAPAATPVLFFEGRPGKSERRERGQARDPVALPRASATALA